MKSIAKTVSWLVVSGLLIAVCTWFESGSLAIGLVAAFWACLLKTPIYWVHEALWEQKKLRSVQNAACCGKKCAVCQS